MTRLLALILLAILVYLLISALLRRLSAVAKIGRASQGRPSPGAPARGPARGEALVRCAACGVRLPESRALPAPPGRGGDTFCSEKCRRRGGPGGGGHGSAGGEAGRAETGPADGGRGR